VSGKTFGLAGNFSAASPVLCDSSKKFFVYDTNYGKLQQLHQDRHLNFAHFLD
jgi:hypothetical protein